MNQHAESAVDSAWSAMSLSDGFNEVPSES